MNLFKKTWNFIVKHKSIFVILLLLLSIIIFIIFLTNNKNNNKNNNENSNLCLLNFNTNGGTAINSLKVECGSKAIKPATPIKEGFEFIGWYIDGELVNFDNLIIDKNIILEAQWKVKENVETIIVHFDSDGGTTINDIEITKGTKINPPLNPTKNGYKFKYWIFNNHEYNFENIVEEDITLKAVWEQSKTQDSNNTSNNEEENNQNLNNVDSKPNDSNSTNNSTSKKSCTYSLIKNYPTSISIMKDTTYQFDNSFSKWDNFSSSLCNITYKTNNSKILTIDSSGLAFGKKVGKTKITICIVDVHNNKELDCFDIDVEITNNFDKEAEKLYNEMVGYYWYLEGSNNSFLKVSAGDYGEYSLKWEGEFLTIEDNKFLTSEQTGVFYRFPWPLYQLETSSYLLIKNNLVHVSNDKLYITLGSKTYTFVKSREKRTIKGTISFEEKNKKVPQNSMVYVNIIKSNPYASYDFHLIQSNDGLKQCEVIKTSVSSDGDTYGFRCYANVEGTTDITIKDSIGGSEAKITIETYYQPVLGIKFEKNEITMKVGETIQLNTFISPHYASIPYVTWRSNNYNVEVDTFGNITAHSPGESIVTVRTNDGGFEDTCKIIIIE